MAKVSNAASISLFGGRSEPIDDLEEGTSVTPLCKIRSIVGCRRIRHFFFVFDGLSSGDPLFICEVDFMLSILVQVS